MEAVKQYVLVAPKGHYFVNPGFFGWGFTKDIVKATKFDTLAEAETKKDSVERAIGCTYWDYEDELPFPAIKEVG